MKRQSLKSGLTMAAGVSPKSDAAPLRKSIFWDFGPKQIKSFLTKESSIAPEHAETSATTPNEQNATTGVSQERKKTKIDISSKNQIQTVQRQNVATIELTVSCRNLPRVALFADPNPIAVLYIE